jgi:hypothetical protein
VGGWLKGWDLKCGLKCGLKCEELSCYKRDQETIIFVRSGWGGQG